MYLLRENVPDPKIKVYVLLTDKQSKKKQAITISAVCVY